MTSAAACAPGHVLMRRDFSFGSFGRERKRARSRLPGGITHGRNLRTPRMRGISVRADASSGSAVEAKNSRSSVEFNLRGSSTAQSRRMKDDLTYIINISGDLKQIIKETGTEKGK